MIAAVASSTGISAPACMSVSTSVQSARCSAPCSLFDNHVHLSESVGGRKQNPLEPGHLSPYSDSTRPYVSELVFRSAAGNVLRPAELEGKITITAAAYDTPPEPLLGTWLHALVSPALLSWRITTLTGRNVSARHTAADFRKWLPPEQNFWRTYTADTYQNDPAIGLHFFSRTPGQYLFNLTAHPFDTGRLEPGVYLLAVTASDTCGNRGTLSQRLRIIPSNVTARNHSTTELATQARPGARQFTARTAAADS